MKLGKSNENVTVLYPVSQKKRQKQRKTLSGSSTCTVHSIPKEYSDVEREVIEEFYRTLVPLGFLPINMFSEKVCEVIAIAHGSPGEWCTYFREVAAANRATWPKSKTLVNLGWQAIHP